MALETSIMKTIKKLLGLPESDTSFDPDILVHINTVISNLSQMGIGTNDGLLVEDTSATWEQLFANDDNTIPVFVESETEEGIYEESTEVISVDSKFQQQVKSYIYLKVKLLFDPPSNGNLLNAIEKNATELEVRLYTLKGGY